MAGGSQFELTQVVYFGDLLAKIFKKLEQAQKRLPSVGCSDLWTDGREDRGRVSCSKGPEHQTFERKPKKKSQKRPQLVESVVS